MKSDLKPCYAGYVQFDVKPGNTRENLNSVRKGLEELNPQRPGLVVLPELWATGFVYKNLEELAEETPQLLAALADISKQYGVYLAGSLPELVESEPEKIIHNTLYIVDRCGVVGSYRKQQLFSPMAEDRHFNAGDNPQPFMTDLGLVGGLVCYDLRFPELAGDQAGQGAAILLVSAQWPKVRKEHWRTLLQARAIENQMFVVACNRSGTTDDIEFAGHSMIIAPDGTILNEAGEKIEIGTASLDPMQVESARARFNTVGAKPYRYDDADKIVRLEALREKAKNYKAVGRKVVFTNGCFDILHEGHVTYLETARKEGDCLIVGLNSDASVKRLGKGDDRPINNELSRARVLAGLGCVDHVVLFEEDTPINLITAIMPDVLVKGGDWTIDKIVGAPEVQAAGGVVKSIPVVENYSTTALIEKIKENNQK